MKNISMSITFKLTTSILIIIILLLTIFTYLRISSEKRLLITEIEKRDILMRDNLIISTKSYILSLVKQVESDLATLNLYHIFEIMKNVQSSNNDILSITILDREDSLILSTNKNYHYSIMSIDFENLETFFLRKKSDTIDFFYPLEFSTQKWGVLIATISLSSLNKKIEVSKSSLDSKIDKIIYESIITAMIFFLLLAVIVYFIFLEVSRPLLKLTKSATDIANGDFDTEIDILKTDNEIAKLSKAFETMRVNLKNLYQKFEEYNVDLQVSVNRKTFELQNTLNKLKSSQDKLIRSEKMAVLGQLVSNVSHEINTPLGAINASVENIEKSLNNLLDDFYNLFTLLDRDELDSFKELLSVKQKNMFLATSQKRELRREMSGALKDLNIEKARYLSNCLITLGIQKDRVLDFKNLLLHREVIFIFDFAVKLKVIENSNINIKEAVNRSSKVILTLKSYYRVKKENSKGFFYLKDTIESVLSLYQNQLGKSIKVIKKFDNLDKINCYEDDLIQVWTNLIQNAIHAMKDRGILTISITKNDNYQVVTIEDTGYGIQDNIKDKIFEPFFTTKQSGEGSGLGLDIVNNIIEKHNGKIEFESDKNTIFKIFLPIKDY